jgi:uncharacterized protein (DUF1501 family)
MDRRVFLRHGLAAASLSLAGLSSTHAAENKEPVRILIVLLRGGMDGLTAVPPIQDPLLSKLRPSINVSSAYDLGNGFGLHPKLSHLKSLWQQQQLNIIHSTGFAYSGRSHFEGQDVMQSGIMKPYTSSSGWMGRALEVSGQSHGVAISIPLPLLLKGRAASTTEYPNWMPPADRTLLQQVQAVWRHDGELRSFSQVLESKNESAMTSTHLQMTRENYEELSSPASLAAIAAARLSTQGGPRVAVIDLGSGFDTHGLQGGDDGLHAGRLAVLDSIVKSFHEGMGDSWKHSMVMTVTEFGRTVAENGTGGTDHGLGSCCFIAGGLLQRSSVLTDWRGLASTQLFEGRDLPATIDTNAVFAEVLQRAFRLSTDQIQSHVLQFKSNPKLQVQWA